MPRQVRHGIRDFPGTFPVSNGQQTGALDAEEGEYGIIYTVVATNALTVDVQASDDGGTTWYTLETLGSLAVGNKATRLAGVIPKTLRLAATAGTGTLSSAALESVRSI